jgi:hypothetical protein
MKMAYILFDKMTTLDFVGFYEAVSWLRILKAKQGVTWDLCSNKEEITDDRGMTIKIFYDNQKLLLEILTLC